MASTYSTNAEIRKRFPLISNAFMHCVTDGEQTNLSILTVSNTLGFSDVGEIQVNNNAIPPTKLTLAYSNTDNTHFYLDAAFSGTIEDNKTVEAINYNLDAERDNAKAYINATITNTKVSNSIKKEIEINYVYGSALVKNCDGEDEVRGQRILENLSAYIQQILKSYKPKLFQGICRRIDDNLTNEEVEDLTDYTDN